MFIYNKDTHLNLIEYGIEVPLLGQRGLLVLEFIKENFPKSFLKTDDLAIPSSEVLSLAHSNDFIKRLINDPTQDIMETFELIQEDGSYHRYNPSNATKSIEDLRDRIFRQVTGTIEACQLALESGFAFHLGGGLHHAMRDRGRGFCLVNDIIIAARHLQKEKKAKSVWVIDVDAHKGDGSAALTQHDDSIRTLSIHMKSGWPLDMGDGSEDWYLPSDIDIPVEPNEDYNQKLSEGLAKLQNFSKADLCIVVSGSDPFEKDELASADLLKLSAEQMLKRDMLVYNFLKKQNIPQVYVMAGGYGRWAHRPYINFLQSIKKDLI